MLSYFKYYIIKTGMKELCLKAMWLCRCVQACLMLGGGGGPTSGGVGEVLLRGVEISLPLMHI